METVLRSLHTSDRPLLRDGDLCEVDSVGIGVLAALGILKPGPPLTSVPCDRCPEECFLDVELIRDSAGNILNASGYCPEPGEGSRLIKVDPVRLKTWWADPHALAQRTCEWLDLGSLPASIASGHAWRLGHFMTSAYSYRVFLAVGLASPSVSAGALESLRSAIHDTLTPLLLVPGSTEKSIELLQSVPSVSLTSLLCPTQHGLGLNVEALKCYLASLRGDRELPNPSGYTFSLDYRTVRRLSTDYNLSPRQARMIKMLHVAWADGSPRLHHTQILAGDNATRVRDVFKNKVHVMRDLLTSDQNGYYELNIPKPE